MPYTVWSVCGPYGCSWMVEWCGMFGARVAADGRWVL